jgi:hypothetical protein
MRARLRLAIVVPAFVCLPLLVPALPAQVFPKTAPQPAAPMLTEAQVRARLLAQPAIEGRIVELNIAKKSVTVEYVHINKKAVDPITAKIAEAKVQFLKQAYDKVVEAKFQPAIDKLGEELSKAQKEASGIEEIPVVFPLRLDAETRLRNMSLPLDDNGKPKKLTADEQRALKGDPRLPGYTATEDDLQMDQTVRFTIDKAKYRPPSKTAKDAAKDADEKPSYPITMLQILPPPKVAPGENPFTKGQKK